VGEQLLEERVALLHRVDRQARVLGSSASARYRPVSRTNIR
jgi:hypothetical protein